MVAAAQVAAEQFRALDQEQVDRIVLAMVQAGVRAAPELARLAIEETGFGVFEDKVVKNFVATEFLYDYLKDKRSVGVIDEDVERNITYVAEPIGVVLAITPVTNPTSTVLYKAIIAAKTRNAVIFRPAPRAIQSCVEAVAVLRAAAAEVGLPENALQVVPDAAHVGDPLPVQALRHRLHLGHRRAQDRRPGECRGEAQPQRRARQRAGLRPPHGRHPRRRRGPAHLQDVRRLGDLPGRADLHRGRRGVRRDGRRAATDGRAGPDSGRRPTGWRSSRSAAATRSTWLPWGSRPPSWPGAPASRSSPAPRCCCARCPATSTELGAHPLVQEKLMPVLGLVRAESEEHAIAVAVLVTEHGGLGHTSAIYATDDDVIRAYSLAVRTGRILVNAPTAVGALGGIYNNLTPTFSLGCGTWGGSSTTENVNYMQLLNIKTVSHRRTPPQWFRVPANSYFNADALENLRDIDTETVLVVTDADTEQRGVVELVRSRLRAEHVYVFSGVYPEPGEEVIAQGVELLDRFRPDLMVAVGGGSVIDAAKAMRLFHEQPTKTLAELTLPFLDPRKRVADYSHRPHSVRLVAIPTTSGTGSEVSPAAVITVGPRKDTLVDYSLVPDIAIVDPLLTLTLPPSVTADSGIDALTHALEALVSIFASPYTEAFCVQSARLIFDALPRAFADGSDVAARTDMSNAATLAGLAFSNAFVGTNHALAHAVGARFDLPHGRANAIFLPHVMRYNAAVPTKFMPAPGYSSYVAPDKYALLGRVVFGGRKPEDSRARLFQAVDTLLEAVQMPRTLKDAGVDEQEFLSALPDLAVTAFLDLSNRTNPRMPLVAELTDLLKKGFYG